MNNQEELINQISNDLYIIRGDRESDKDWIKRIIYSSIGRQAFASLWDRDSGEVSIIHFKQKIEELFLAWKSIFPEVFAEICIDPTTFAEEVYEIFEHSGLFYHSPNYLTPAPERIVARGTLYLYRGASLNRKMKMSGFGSYLVENSNEPMNNYLPFGIDSHSLNEFFEREIKTAQFKKAKISDNVQFLRTSPPFKNGYWKPEPDKDGKISILRIGSLGQYLYYFYKWDEQGYEISQISEWKSINGNYRLLSSGILQNRGTLPCIEFHKDGSICSIKLNYLLPPAELNYFILFSWPKSYWKDHSYFERIMVSVVFEDFKDVLENKGFVFKEV